MRQIELAGFGALCASDDSDELPFFRKLYDSGVAITVGYKDVAIRSHEYVGRAIEGILRRVIARGAFFPERQQQRAVRGELLNEVVGIVGDPDETGFVDAYPVREFVRRVSPGFHEASIRIENEKGRRHPAKNDNLTLGSC